MKKRILFFLIIVSAIQTAACSRSKETFRQDFSCILKIPLEPKGVVLLFPSFGYPIVDTDLETGIDEAFLKSEYAVVLVDYNRELFLDETNFESLHTFIQRIIKNNNLPDNIIVGGFSSGGNIALSYSIWYEKLQLKEGKPKSIFVIDAPVDLLSLYNVCSAKTEKSVAKTEDLTEEKYLVQFLKDRLGDPKEDKLNYYKYSPFIAEEIANSNLKYLLDYTILFYSEPDRGWYKENMNYDYEETNSFRIQTLFEALQKTSKKEIQYIKTMNKGFRKDGKRHPHSWSIVNETELVKWVNKNNK